MVAELVYFAAAEGDGGKMLNIEEVGAAQMRVAIRVPCSERAGINFDFN